VSHEELEPIGKLTEKLIASVERVNTAVCQMTFHVTDARKKIGVGKQNDGGRKSGEF
jgi:hypothetical protein